MRTKEDREGDWHRPRTVWVFFMSFNFAVVFNFNVFPFPPSKAQFLGDVPMNRQKRSESLDRDRDRDNEEDGDSDGDEEGTRDGDREGDVKMGRRR